MSETEIVILPEDIYKLFIISDPPENFADFDAFGCADCQEPVGINKPEGIPDLPPYVPKKQRLSNDNQQQPPNHNRQQQHKFNFQRGGKFNKGQQHQQQQQQQQQKKIVSTVEVSPEFANKDLGTWAKKAPAQTASPALSPSSSSPATNVKFAPSFNPEKAPAASPYSSTSFNPQLVSQSSNKSSSNSSATLFQPQSTQSYHAQQQAAQSQQAQQPQQQQQSQPQKSTQPQSKPAAPKAEVPIQKHSSGWGNVQSKPKPQSFAQLLNEESSKPVVDNRSPSFKPETISRPPQAEQIAVSNDDKNWPSLSSINKPKANSPWGNIKP